jgi:hypothetical protein
VGEPATVRGATYAKAKASDGAALKSSLIDRDPGAANALVKPSARNINQGNKQIAHGVNRVLRPADL